MENRLTVGQLAQKHNISARAVRHYEDMGLLQSTRDMESNYRIYGEAESDRLYQILLLKGMGFSLKEISAIITSAGKKVTITNIIKNRLKNLEKKAVVFNSCIEILNEFLEACTEQDDENIDSIKLLSRLISDKSINQAAAADEQNSQKQAEHLMKDKDLEILNSVRSEDFNALYLPFILGQEDADILENFFINHRRYWGLNNVLLSDGTSLQDIYDPRTMAETIRGRIANAVLNDEGSLFDPDTTYKKLVTGLCNIIMNLEYDPGEAVESIEIKLTIDVFLRAIEILEFSGRLNNDNIKQITMTIGLDLAEYTWMSLRDAVLAISSTKGKQAYNLAWLVNNSVKRYVLAGPYYAMTDYEALNSRCWLLDRALDLEVRLIWSREIEVSGQLYKTLASVIFQIALMRARMLYAPASFICPEIIKMKETKIIGPELRTTDQDGASWRQVPEFENIYFDRSLANHIPDRINPGIRYGLVCRYQDDYFSYITGEEVGSFEIIPEGMTGEVIPEGMYAVFEVRGGPLPYRVKEMTEYAYQVWLPASDYKYQYRPHLIIFENEYIGRVGCVDSCIKVCIPVEPREVEA